MMLILTNWEAHQPSAEFFEDTYVADSKGLEYDYLPSDTMLLGSESGARANAA